MNNIFSSDIFKDIDPDFLNKIEKTIASMNGKSDIEVIGTFMALSNEASKRGISLNSEQQKTLILFLRDSLHIEKRPKFDSIVAMFNK